MRNICVITGSRAEYGIFKPVLDAIKRRKSSISIIVVGMHISEEFGSTVREIEKDGFKIDAKIVTLHKKDSKAEMAKSVGKCVFGIAKALNKIKPDIVLLLGDRSETFAGAIAATYLNIPVAHIHGGEVSGNVDELVRHAITKLSHIHFATTKESAERIIKLGENPSNVFTVGAPALDLILNKKLIEKEKLTKKYNLDLSKPILLVIQHSVVAECNEAEKQIRETLESIIELHSELNHQVILIYPNADVGGRRIIKVIKKYEMYPFIKTFKNIPYKEYLSLMRLVSVMVGNSSGGIIEAPSFKLPVVNIGTRQKGRERADNVIDVDYDKEQIKRAIKKALYDKKFIRRVKRCKSPYGDGNAGIRIANILSKIKIDEKLVQKKMTY